MFSVSTKFATPVLAASLLFGVDLQSAHAANPQPQQTCVFDKYAPVAAAPYVTENSIDYGSYSFLGGAQLFVPAREGLTKEWLAASVEKALASSQLAAAASPTDAQSSKTCESPHFKDVHVAVVSGGDGFWVQLIAKDSHTSEALLKWARGIVDQHKSFHSASAR